RPPPKDARPAVTPPAASPPSHAAPATGSSALSPAQAELLDRLRQAFQATPAIPETPERTRKGYILAIESLADYLEEIGADSVCIQRIDELGWALEDLTNGVPSPLLQPTRSKRNSPTLAS